MRGKRLDAVPGQHIGCDAQRLTLVDGGATFRVFAPNAVAVYLNGTFNGKVYDGDDAATFLEKRGSYWTGFIAGATDGDRYRFWVEGPSWRDDRLDYKRSDPYARELLNAGGAPGQLLSYCFSVIRASDGYPWHDAGFRTPDFSDMVIYQAHIGVYAITKPGVSSNLLDVASKVPYIAALNVNVRPALSHRRAGTKPMGLGYGGDRYILAMLSLCCRRGGPAKVSCDAKRTSSSQGKSAAPQP